MCIRDSKRTVGCGQFYVHEGKGLKVAVHGDDFLSTGPSDSLRWFDGFIRKAFKVKYGVRLGPGQALEGGFLGRTLKFHPGWGYEYCPSRLHIDNAARKAGVEGSKPVSAPGVRDHGAVLSDALDLLEPAERDRYFRRPGP